VKKKKYPQTNLPIREAVKRKIRRQAKTERLTMTRLIEEVMEAYCLQRKKERKNG
jgi:hypothetical protein